MGLLFADPPPRPSARVRLYALLSVLRSQAHAIVRTQRDIGQLLTDHPELERYVPDEVRRKPRIVVNNDQPLRCGLDGAVSECL